MGKRTKRYEEDACVGSCMICSDDIILDFFMDKGDVVFCKACSSEYIVISRNPVRFELAEDDYYGDLSDLAFD